MYTHTHTHTHVHMHTHTHTHTDTHTHTHTHTHTCTRTRTHTHTHTYTLTLTHTHVYTHMHTHSHSHSHIHTHKSHTHTPHLQFGELVEFLCKCSFLEIYNEQVYDLLDPASCGLHLRENIKHGVYVDGLSEVSVSCARDAYEVLSTGWVNRKVASTSMNRESSRSHAVFTLTVESKKRVQLFTTFFMSHCMYK